MGGNNRFLDDYCRPYESDEDRDAYDNWHHYLETCRQEELSGLSSQNVEPGSLTPKPRDNPPLTALREFVAKLKGIISS